MDMAPATSPAMAVVMMLAWLGWAAATPATRLAVEIMPSLAPRTRGAQPSDMFSAMTFRGERDGGICHWKIKPMKQSEASSSGR